MEPLIFPLLILIALVAGVLLGWIIGKKASAARAEGVSDSLRLQLDGVREERDTARGELKETLTKLDAARDRAGRLDADLAGLRAQAEERERAFEVRIAEANRVAEERIAELKSFNEESKKALSDHFSQVGNKLLGEAQKAFLERADQRFHQQGEKAEEKIKQLLSPVGERLKAYEDQVGKIEKDRTEAYGNLRSLMDQMREGQARVSSETAKLVNSLRNAPKARGRWGEHQLKNVLESCGLSEHVDFVTERSVTTEDGGRLRPDAIIRTPGGRNLVVDAKVSLNDYQDAFEAGDEEARETAMTRHTRSMKAHIDGLSKKAYWDQFDDTPDYVIMFVPGEHFLAAALEHDPTLWDHAFEKRVLLATPTNLVAIARTVSGVWRQEKMADQARLIGQLGKEMYDRLATAAEHLKRVGGGLNSAVGNYNKFVGSFERNVLATGRKFAELNIETGKKELDIVDEVEALPRYGTEEEPAAMLGDARSENERDAAE